jgi:hypothetical protein
VRAGVPPATAERQALTELYFSVNYQADNLTDAEMCGVFGTASLVLAGLVLLGLGGRRLRRETAGGPV